MTECQHSIAACNDTQQPLQNKFFYKVPVDPHRKYQEAGATEKG